MDPRRFLTASAVGLTLGGCALLNPERHRPAPTPQPAAAFAAALEAAASPATSAPRPSEPPQSEPPQSEAPADAVIGGVQVFGWREGRIYPVRTAPLRVTALALAPGETVTAKAAGDTVRWQIGEAASGRGPSARTHVLIKPLQSGLETNLVLTTNQRVYLLSLRSGPAGAFNAAVAWDYGAVRPSPDAAVSPSAVDAPVIVAPQGPVDAGYRITPEGRPPRWTPSRVFNDGVRTFIVLPPAAAADEVPAVFIRTGRRLQLVNYRQAGDLLVVDRLFDAAELRLGADRPEIVRIRRLPGAAR
jgi:P-type conjugative transfer protein TrbG